MKKITVEIKTKKGEAAYDKISTQKRSLSDKMIVNKVFREKIIQKKPFPVIEIKVLISWLAVQIDITKQIVDGMGQYRALRNIDYTIKEE